MHASQARLANLPARAKARKRLKAIVVAPTPTFGRNDQQPTVASAPTARLHHFASHHRAHQKKRADSIVYASAEPITQFLRERVADSSRAAAQTRAERW